MIVNFSNIDQQDRPILILKRADETPLGVLGYATDIELEANYNELSILNFRLPAYVDGKEVPLYDELTGFKIVELKDVAQFVLNKPVESGDAVNISKQVEAYSLEHEFARKKIVLPESTYKFYDYANQEGTLLKIIMELMPNWKLGSIASGIINKYRTFSVSNENLYNFMIDTVQQAYNCIFEFDTLNRKVNVRDASLDAGQKQVYISRDNLAKDIEVEESLEDVVTRLDVSGADGVDIREVNPTGSNQIINLDFFMTEKNFTAEMIARYNAWKQLIADNKQAFYNAAIQYSILLAQEITENAKLADLRGEYTSLENVQSVIIQGIASKLKTQSDLDEANVILADKQSEIDAKLAEIAEAVENKNEAMDAMKAITNLCAYNKYFTDDERKAMDAYIRDDEIADPSFVASELQTYTDGAGNSISNTTITVTDAEIVSNTTASGSIVRSVTGGLYNVAGIVTGASISAVFEERTNGKIVISFYSGKGSYTGTVFPSACITVSGKGSMVASETGITCNVSDAYLFFSLNASDYEKKTIAWELYAYGEEILRKLASPSYTFSVDSANFIALPEFEKFKNELELGEKIYIGISKDRVLRPICTGAKIRYSERPYLELVFSDSYTGNDSSFKLADILGNGISMGKTLSTGKFTYSAFTDSGASTELRHFIESALDTAKNAIMSSTEQAVSWDGAGLRLRRWSNEAHTAYDPEQIWMSNNSIVMTDDSWATAKMAIGKFSDVNLGDCWGIVAPLVVGTLLAGEELVIESQKKSDSETEERVMFRVDADGVRLYNADFEIQRTNSNGTTTQILIDPSIGLAMGYYPLLNSDGSLDFDPENSQGSNAKFFADMDGTLYLAGTIYAFDGIIGGWRISQDGLYSGKTDQTSVGMTSEGDIRIWAGRLPEEKKSAPFYVKQDGTLHATLGQIGGWHISAEHIGNDETKGASTVGMASSVVGTDIVFWAGHSTPSSANFYVQADGKLKAANIEVVGGSISIKDEDEHILFYVDKKGGQIGTWYFGSDYIGNTDKRYTSLVGLSAATGDDTAFWAGNKMNDLSTAAFRVTGNGKVEATDLHIYGGDITISNMNDEVMFSVTNEGYLTSKFGSIGGWHISDTHIGNEATAENSSVGLYSPATGDDIVFWAGSASQENASFSLTANGALTMRSGSISIKNANGDEMFAVSSLGSLTAKDGTIGGWFISNEHIGTIATKATSPVGLANATGEGIVFWAGNDSGNVVTSKFRVNAKGAVTATSGQIGGWYIGESYIGNANTKERSTVGLYAGVNDDDIVIWAGSTTPSNANMYITAKGKLYCSNLDISGGGINVNSGVFKVESDGTFTSTKGNIGGWTITQDWLTVGSGYTNVTLNGVGRYYQDWAMWCGNDSPDGDSPAPFRVKRNGDLYINALKVWSGSDWETVDFSGDFSNAVSLQSGGSWSGNTFTATVKLWGKISKNISISASLGIKDYKLLVLTASTATVSLWIRQTVNGKESGDYVEEIDVPVGTAVQSFIDAGYEEGKKDYRPDSITEDISNKVIHIFNADGDQLDTYGYSVSNTYEAGKKEGAGDATENYNRGWNACRAKILDSESTGTYYTGTKTTKYDAPTGGAQPRDVLYPYKPHTIHFYDIPDAK